MTINKTNNYFDSINDFLNNGNKLLVLHESNINYSTTEEFFLLLNKKSINYNLENIFTDLSIQSHSALKSLSKATQLFIASKDKQFYFIHLTSMPYAMDKDHNSINADTNYIYNNFQDVIITAYPHLKDEAISELSLSRTCFHSVKANNLDDTTENIIKVSKEVLLEIKKDADELLIFTKKFLDVTSKEKTEQIQKKIDSTKPILDEKIILSKEKLFQISSSFKDSFLKQKKIFSKMKSK